MLHRFIRCACILHNICIDAGDVDMEEAAAARTDAERAQDLEARQQMSELVDESLEAML